MRDALNDIVRKRLDAAGLAWLDKALAATRPPVHANTLLGFYAAASRKAGKRALALDAAEQGRVHTYSGVASRRALVDVGFVSRDGLRVRPAARVAALGALRLRQERVDPLDERIHRARPGAASPLTISPTTAGPR